MSINGSACSLKHLLLLGRLGGICAPGEERRTILGLEQTQAYARLRRWILAGGLIDIVSNHGLARVKLKRRIVSIHLLRVLHDSIVIHVVLRVLFIELSIVGILIIFLCYRLVADGSR